MQELVPEKFTLIHFFEQSVEKFSDRIYLWEKKQGENVYSGTSYSETRQQVHLLAAGLMAMGLKKGDRVALLSEGRNAWVISELALLYNGAINVPLSVKLTEPEEIRFRLDHSGARMVIVSGNQAHKIRSIKKYLPKIEKVILLDGTADKESGEISYKEISDAGEAFLKSGNMLFEERYHSVLPDDSANICYTSGTSADPKGIVLTHRNYVTNIIQGYSLMDITPDYRTLLILPWDHAFAHTAGIYCFMGKGASVASVQSGKTQIETVRNISQNIKEIRPTLLLSVPALASNFKKNIEKGIHEKGRLIERLFRHAMAVSYSYNADGWRRGAGFSFFFKPILWFYDKLLFHKIRDGFGGKLEFFIGGGALLDIEYQRFFYALGIPMFQGYGLSEASPIIASNSVKKHKLGSSGIIVSHLEIRICDGKGNDLPTGGSGEIVVKGDNVMKEYWRNEEATRNTIRNSWLYTGDLGYVDPDGFLYVVGRFKSLLIASDGEKFSPEGMEEAFAGQSEFINQCMLYNNQNPYTVVLVVPNREKLKSYLQEKSLLPDSPEGRETALVKLGKELQEYGPSGRFNSMFPKRWLPAAVGILREGFTEENHLMNSTMKIVRGKVIERHKELIDFLYTPEAKVIINMKNLETMKGILS
jgi:long-chain acyl-CoA synthetase